MENKYSRAKVSLYSPIMPEDQDKSIQALWVALGHFSSFGLTIISAAILSRYFSKIEYGTYRQVLYVYNTLLILFTVGLPQVFAYYLPRYKREQGLDIVYKISKLLLLTGILFSLFLYFFAGIIATLLKNPELATGLKFFSPIPALLLPTMGIEGIFSTYKKTIYIALYNIITRFLTLLFIVLPVILLNGTYIYSICGWVIVSILSFFIAIWFKRIPFLKIKSKTCHLSYSTILSYSIPLVGAGIAGMAAKASYHFYISISFGPQIFADFANGFIEIPFVAMVTSAASTILLPIFSKQIHDKADINNITSVWNSTIIKSAMIIYPLVLFFICHADTVITLLYSSKYLDAANFFRIAMILNFFNIIVFAPLLLAMGQTAYYAKIHVYFAIIAWTGGFILLQIINMPATIAVFATSLGIIKVIIFTRHSARLLEIPVLTMIPLKRLMVLFLNGLVILVPLKMILSKLLPQINPFLELTVNFTIFLILFILLTKLFYIDYRIIIQPFIEKLLHGKGQNRPTRQ